MSAVEELNSGDTSPLKGPAPTAQPEDTSDVDKNEDIMPLTSPGDQPVQFVPGQPLNGDAKVEIGDAGGPPAFVGLGKEELMKYANDPFWVRLRWLLFILFWALWVAMLAGAIVIIVLAPKCAEKKVGTDSFYELNLKNFAKDGKLSDLGDRANYLSDLGVTSVIIGDVLKTDEFGGVMDFKNVDEQVGTVAEFTEALRKLKNAGLRVLMTLVPNHSSTKHEWFVDSEHKFHDYYVRKPESEVFGSSWLVVNSKASSYPSAWAEDPHHNGTRYLQLFDKTADLNLKNEEVVAEMANVYAYWKGKGVDAFVIPAASYLVEDYSRLKEQSATINHPDNIEVVRTILKKQSNEPSSFVEVKGLLPEDASKYLANGVVPLSTNFDVSTTLDQYTRVPDKINFFQQVHKSNHPVIRLSGPAGRLQGQNQDEANILRLLSYTSNASVILHYGDEVDGFDRNSNTMNWDQAKAGGTTFTLLKKLSNIQRTLVDEPGKGFTYPYKGPNSNVFAFVRSEKYVVIVNFGPSQVEVDFAELLGTPDATAEVIIATPNADGLPEKTKLTKMVSLPGRSGVLLEKTSAAE